MVFLKAVLVRSAMLKSQASKVKSIKIRFDKSGEMQLVKEQFFII